MLKAGLLKGPGHMQLFSDVVENSGGCLCI